MKRFLFLCVLLLLIGFSVLQFVKEKVRSDIYQPVIYPTTSPASDNKPVTARVVSKDEKTTTSLFVPYWTITEDALTDTDYNQLIYFGVVPGKNGINMQEAGAKKLDMFVSSVPQDKEKLLTVRMIESGNNFDILEDQKIQKKIITDTVTLAKQNNFSGILLDLEITAIPFESLINQINSFSDSFYKNAKSNGLKYSITFYGDTFYRLRPFEVKKLANSADSVFIMAYDFHKAKGNPGPDFPLRGKNTYGYDMTKMTDDFLQYVPAKKVTVIFGLFGYDWKVDGNDKSVSQGKPLTYNEAQQKFLNSCEYASCMVKRDTVSSETEVKYTDEDNEKHIVWFEDFESIAAKKKHLKENGISSFSFWANSYF